METAYQLSKCQRGLLRANRLEIAASMTVFLAVQILSVRNKNDENFTSHTAKMIE